MTPSSTFKEFKEAVNIVYPEIELNSLFIEREEKEVMLQDFLTLNHMKIGHDDVLNEYVLLKVKS